MIALEARGPGSDLRLDALASLIDAVGFGAVRRADGFLLRTTAGHVRTVAERWRTIESGRAWTWERRHRWADAPVLADACVSVATVAARRRGSELTHRVRLAERLREASRFLAAVEPGRAELVRAALDLAWAAGMLPPIDPPSCVGDSEAVLRALQAGIVLAATLEAPDVLHHWQAGGRHDDGGWLAR